MNLNKFLFVVATTKKESEAKELPILKSFNLINIDKIGTVDTKIFFENKDGLSEIYNSILNNEEYTNKYDFISFVHDDIWVNDVFIFDKIEKISKNSDIIGVCGGKAWNSYGNLKTPIIWTKAAQSKGTSGFMIHAADSKQDKIEHDEYYNGRSLFASGYGNSPSQVLTIDGCFMCFTKKAIEKGVRFDNSFRFHFYDIDMCFTAYVKNAKISTAPILLTHESLGYSVMQPEYMESQNLFLKKWFS